MRIDPRCTDTFGDHRSLAALVARQCSCAPRLVPFFTKRFAACGSAELRLCEELSQQIIRLTGDEIDAFIRGYEFLCLHQRREEIHFRRHNRYRLSTLAQATSEVYGNLEYMQQYMRGLLLSQVFWSNHTAAIAFYLEELLARAPCGYDLLEVGPGHGLLFGRAVADPRAGTVVGWDLSAVSILESERALRALGVTRPYRLEQQDVLEPPAEDAMFDTVVLSEVLEHLETPGKALETVRAILRPNGCLYVNFPVNCPAPDHLFLLRSPEEAVAFVQAHGFSIERSAFFPATNHTLEVARQDALTISVCLIARKNGP